MIEQFLVRIFVLQIRHFFLQDQYLLRAEFHYMSQVIRNINLNGTISAGRL